MSIPLPYAARLPFPCGRHITWRQVSLREDCLPSGFPSATADDSDGPRASLGVADPAHLHRWAPLCKWFLMSACAGGSPTRLPGSDWRPETASSMAGNGPCRAAWLAAETA
jgi:hypothetical protein